MDGLPSQGSTKFLPTSGFMLESGKGVFGNGFNWDSKQKMVAQCFFCLLCKGIWRIFAWFYLDANLGEGGGMVDMNLILNDVCEVLEDCVHGSGMQVDASNDHHVICATKDSAFQGKSGFQMFRSDEVACSVSQQW